MSVAVSATARDIRFGAPVPLFGISRSYDVSANGQQFLALTPVEEPEASPMAIVTNWRGLAKHPH